MNNQTIQNNKYFTIDCDMNFENNFQLLKNGFESITNKQRYKVYICSCSSNTKTKQIFKLLFKNPKPNMTSF